MDPSVKTPWLIITQGDIVLPGGDVLEGGTLILHEGYIHDILEGPLTSFNSNDEETCIINAEGCWVTPGLIDQHLHGGFGIDFNQSPMGEIHQLLKELPLHGVTGITPTVMSSPKLDMIMSISRVEEAAYSINPKEARVFGIHLEGPFLSPHYNGAHAVESLLSINEDNMAGLFSPSITRVTFAPELDPQGNFIRHLRERNILCAMGHSDADYETAVNAVQAGVTSATHVFNAMRPLKHRDPGIVAAALTEDSVFVEMIADGQHLAPAVIKMILKIKPFEKVLLISDCNALTGLKPGSAMQFGNQQITAYPEGYACNEDGRLAGSTHLITDCLRNIVSWGLLTFPDAVQLATYHPALHLGQAPQFGVIALEAAGDIVLWDKATLNIETVILKGQLLAAPFGHQKSMPKVI